MGGHGQRQLGGHHGGRLNSDANSNLRPEVIDPVRALSFGTVISAMALRAAGALATFGFTLVVSRALGAAEYGLLALLQSWSAFLEVALGLGLPMYVARAVVERDLFGPTGLAEGLLARARWVTITVSAGAIGLIFFGRSELTQLLAPGAGAPWLIWMAGFLAAIRADTRLSSEGIKARFQPTRGVALQFVFLPSALLGALLAARATGVEISARGVTILYIILAAFVAVLGRAFWRLTRENVAGPCLATNASDRDDPTPRTRGPSRASLAIRRGRAAGFLWAFSLVDVAFPAVALTLVGVFAGPREVGVFGAASRITDLAGIGLAGVASIYGPRFASAHVRSDYRNLRSCIRSAQIWSLVIFAPVCAVCLVAPGAVLGIFGQEFASGEGVLRVLALGQLVNAASGAVGVYLQMARGEVVGVWIGAASVIVLGISSALLGSHMGLLGLSIAYSVSVALKNCALYAAVSRRARDPR